MGRGDPGTSRNSGLVMRIRKGRLVLSMAVAAILMGGSGCDGEATPSSQQFAASQSTPADQLAAIDGSASASDFQGVLDCLVASGSPGTKTEQQIADTTLASWNASSQRDSLWAFTKALGSVYGC